MQVSTLPKFLNQWRCITSNRYVLNMVKGQHLQLRCYLHYSIISDGLTLAALAHHPIFQKEANEVLAKGTIESSSDTGGAGFYSNVFFVP